VPRFQKYSCAAWSNANAGNKLKCFSGTTDGTIYGGTCSVTAGGVATLNNTDGDPDGDYSGVYFQNSSSLGGKPLGTLAQLGFSYSGAPTAGSPRISLPIDTNNDGVTDFYAFIGAFYCNDDTANTGAGNVDAINDSTCTIFAGPEVFDNWTDVLTTHPEWRVGKDLPFVIADDIGLWTISNVVIVKAK
jgi:hypothetical protein